GSGAGHAGAAGAANAGTRANARLGHCAADRAYVGRGFPGEPGLAVPGPAAHEAEGLDPLGVARDGEQPARALLRVDARGANTARSGAACMGTCGGSRERGADLVGRLRMSWLTDV